MYTQILTDDDEKFLEAVADSGGFEKTWSGYKNHNMNGSLDWKLALPFKDEIIKDKTLECFVRILNAVGLSGSINDFKKSKWKSFKVNYLDKLSAAGESSRFDGKRYKLKSSNRKFITRIDIPTSGSDFINIQFLDDKDIIQLPLKDFNDEAVEID
jgi:hypothetical protein